MSELESAATGAPFACVYRGDGWAVGRWRCAGADDPASEERVGWHEVVVPMRGVFVRERLGEEVLGSPNVALLANRGDTYRVRHPVPCADECLVFLLGMEALEDLGRSSGGVTGMSEPRFRVDHLATPSRVFLAAAHLLRHGGKRDPLDVESDVAWILAELLAAEMPRPPSPDRTAVGGRHRRAVLRGMEFMAAHYRTPISLSEIAGAAAYSPFHFARVFRRFTGLPPYLYVTRLRLRDALMAVLDGESDLTGLAFRLGFSSHSHMTAAFRAEYGRPPSRIRARFR